MFFVTSASSPHAFNVRFNATKMLHLAPQNTPSTTFRDGNVYN